MMNTGTPPLLFEDLSTQYQRLIRRPSRLGVRVSHPRVEDVAPSSCSVAARLRSLAAHLQTHGDHTAFFAVHPAIAAEFDRLVRQEADTLATVAIQAEQPQPARRYHSPQGTLIAQMRGLVRQRPHRLQELVDTLHATPNTLRRYVCREPHLVWRRESDGVKRIAWVDKSRTITPKTT